MSVATDEFWVELVRVSGASPGISIMFGVDNLCCADNNLDSACQSGAINIGVSADPTIDRGVADHHFSVGIAETIKCILRRLAAKSGKMQVDDFVHAWRTRGVPDLLHNFGYVGCSPVSGQARWLRDNRCGGCFFFKHATGGVLQNIHDVRVILGGGRAASKHQRRDQYAHIFPLHNRVAPEYSGHRLAKSRHGIETPLSKALPAPNAPFRRGFLWSGMSRASSDAPLAFDGSLNRGMSGHQALRRWPGQYERHCS